MDNQSRNVFKNQKVGPQLKLRLEVLSELKRQLASEVSVNSNLINIAIGILQDIGWQTFTTDKCYNDYKHGQITNAFNQKPQGGSAAETTTDSANVNTTVEITSKR